ncbi:MAG: hypothetical protein RLZZ403_671, partial [Pseudomonadota bacterium]
MSGNIAYIGTTTSSKTTSGAKHSITRYKTSKTQETLIHELTDNGAGGLGPWGTVNYVGKSVNVKFVDLDSSTEGYKSDYENAESFENSLNGQPSSGSESMSGGEYGDAAVSEQILAASTVSVT